MQEDEGTVEWLERDEERYRKENVKISKTRRVGGRRKGCKEKVNAGSRTEELSGWREVEMRKEK